MSMKLELVERAGRGEPVAALCREFGVSRTTAHKWLKRYKEQGPDGLEDQSRRPRSAPLATAEDIVVAVLEARDAHPRWGPETLRLFLQRRFKDQTPSRRTIARIIKRAGRVRARKKRRPPSVVEQAPTVSAEKPNDVWTVDFKGWWRAVNGQRCEPLTVRDAYSRFVLACRLCKATTRDVRAEFERAFRRYGIPAKIQCDNGTPFVAVRAPAGLSSLSAWWISLGIELVRSRPGCPQDNGGHERVHRNIAEDVQAYPAADAKAQQRALDRWRQEFNHVRPHQALGGKTPGEVYTPSERRGLRPIVPSYPSHFRRVLVARNGHFAWDGEKYFLSGALAGHYIALELFDDLHARVWFHQLCLTTVELVPHLPDSIYLGSHTSKRAKDNRRKSNPQREQPLSTPDH